MKREERRRVVFYMCTNIIYETIRLRERLRERERKCAFKKSFKFALKIERSKKTYLYCIYINE